MNFEYVANFWLFSKFSNYSKKKQLFLCFVLAYQAELHTVSDQGRDYGPPVIQPLTMTKRKKKVSAKIKRRQAGRER